MDAKCFIGNLRRNQKFLAPYLQIKTSIRKSRIWFNILSEQKAKYQIRRFSSGLVAGFSNEDAEIPKGYSARDVKMY